VADVLRLFVVWLTRFLCMCEGEAGKLKLTGCLPAADGLYGRWVWNWGECNTERRSLADWDWVDRGPGDLVSSLSERNTTFVCDPFGFVREGGRHDAQSVLCLLPLA
jgi:hypothetical protein